MSSSSDSALSGPARVLRALDEAAAKLEAAERARLDPIAIIGLGCRFPGGVRDASSYWRLLRSGVDAVRLVPDDRWDADALYDPDPEMPGRICTRSGGFLDEVDRFDAAFFGLSPREAAAIDPQQRLLLEVAHEALDAAGRLADRLAPNSTGVFVGLTNNDYAHLLRKAAAARPLDQYFVTGNSPNAAAGRVSYLLGLRGPSMVVDSACSSSLVAVHLACQSLRAGDCNLALAGGVNLILAPEASIALSRARMLSPDGRCKTFDAAADGYGRGEGCGLVVLKRLSDAQRDNDRVLAVIRGSAVNQDGPAGGFTVPSGAAQRSLLSAALARAQLNAGDIDYVEAHGTGTALGDPIEIGALSEVFGSGRPAGRPLLVGSVKTNFGHLESAAGVAGLIKAVLALWHGEIPAHLHFKTPSRHIAWEDVAVRVAASHGAWPGTGQPRRAGVSAFGVSGTNAHVILESAPAGLAAAVLLAPRRSFRGERHWFEEPAASPRHSDPFYGVEWRHCSRRERTRSPVPFADAGVHSAHMGVWLKQAGAHPGSGAYAAALEALEAIARLFARRAVNTVAPRDVAPAYLRLFARVREIADSGSGGDPAEAESVAEKLRAACPDAEVEITMLTRCGARLPDVLRGVCDPLTLLFPSGGGVTAADLYGRTPCARRMNELVGAAVAGLMSAEAGGKPLRVLELGAGTGGTTAAVLRALAGGAVEYVFTDVSPLFVAAARKRFSGTPGMDCRVLDIERDPLAQGFAPGEFDIIVAANVLHATRDLRATLGHVRSLLAADCCLVLLEAVRPLGFLDLVFGLTDGWWRFTDSDLRPAHALLDPEIWRRVLAGAGFSGIGTFGFEPGGGAIFAQQAVIVARTGGEVQAPVSATGSWLLVADHCEIAERLAEQLEHCGGSCHVVAPEPVEALATAVGNGPLRGVAYFASPGVTDPKANKHLRPALALVQALVARPAPLAIITRGAVAAGGGDGVPGVAQAVLWGFARSLAQEHPELSTIRLDLDPAMPPDEAAAALRAELVGPDGEDQVAWRGGERLVARLVRVAVAPATPARLSNEATYLIVGGMGGLGRPLARQFVERGARHLVLASRRDTGAAAAEFLAGFAAFGADVRVARVDVAKEADVARVLAEIAATPWPLRGVVHAAGVLDDGVVRTLTWAQMERVLAPKVAGAWHLHHLTRDLPLDFFVLFSSATALLGSPGQANHAAANAFLDALAHYRRASGLCALSIGWGPWAEIGAAAARGVGERFRGKGIGTLTPADGWEKLDRLLASPTAHVAVLRADWGEVDPQLTAGPFFRELRIEPAASGDAAEPSLAGPALAELPAAERQSRLLGEVRRQVAHVLGLGSGGQIDPQLGFFSSGMDSLTSVELRNRLQTRLGRSLPSTVVFDYPTAEALAAHLAAAGALPSPSRGVASTARRTARAGATQLDGLSAGELSALLDEELKKH